MSKTLYIDIDSTIWPAEDEYHKACLELYGERFGDQWYNTDQLAEKYGKDYTKIFEKALNPDNVHNRVLYPYAAYAINYLGTIGYDIHFLSHNPKPKSIHGPVEAWLQEKLQIPFDLTIMGARNDKINFMDQDMDAWGIIEDKPSTLLRAFKSNYVTLAKWQPWNWKTVEEHGILGFYTWGQVPLLIHRLQEEGYSLAVDHAQ